MGDVGEMYSAMNTYKKRQRQERYERADDTGWKKHTSHHWYVDTPVGKLSYWPSTGAMLLNSTRVRSTERYIIELAAAEGVKMNE